MIWIALPEKATDDAAREISAIAAPSFRQIQNLCRTRDLLLPRLLSGKVNLAEN